MIRENDLREAIAEMKEKKNPTANTCIKLAAYYTILDHVTERTPPTYSEMSSYSAGGIEYTGESDFAKAIYGKDPGEVWAVIDELMTTLQVIHPRLYSGVMAKL